MADIRFRQAAFLGVDQIIRFDQNLVVDAVNRAKRVVVRHQPDDALDRIGWDIGPFKKCPGQRRALLLLVFAVGAAVFFAAQRAGDIMNDGCRLEEILSIRIELILQTDQPCKLVNL